MTGLPGGWEWACLGEVAHLVRGVSFKKSESSSVPGSDRIPIMRAGNVQDGRLRLDDDLVWVPQERVSPAQFLRRGDIVVATSSGSASVVGKSGRAQGDWRGAHGAFMTVVRPVPGAEPTFLYWWLQTDSVRRAWSAASSGTSINNLKVGTLTSTPVPIPPLPEQERIVAAIEEHLSALEAGLSNLQTADRRVEVLEAAVLQSVLEQRGEWSQVEVGEVADLSLGKMLDKKRQTGEHPTPYLRNINVRWGAFDLSDVATMDVRPEEFDRVSVREDDLVMCEGGEPGRCAVWMKSEPIAIQKALHRIRPRPDVSAEFLALVFRQKAITGELARHFTGTTIKHLPKERLKRVTLGLPPLDVQNRAVADAAAQDDAIRRLRSEIDIAVRRASRMRTAVLSTAFSGQLVSQDPSEEPAAVLLERIKAERDGRSRKLRATP